MKEEPGHLGLAEMCVVKSVALGIMRSRSGEGAASVFPSGSVSRRWRPPSPSSGPGGDRRGRAGRCVSDTAFAHAGLGAAASRLQSKSLIK